VGNPVRQALDRAFPMSPTTCSAATAARSASACLNDDFHPYGQQWKPSAVSAAPAPSPAKAAKAAAQAGHLLSDAGLISRSCSGGGAMTPSAFAPTHVTWPARRSRRTGSSSGGSFQISASDAGSMSISAEGSSSGRSSFDHTGSQGRASLDGNNSNSDASDRSERCAAPPALAAGRNESMSHPPPAPRLGSASPEQRAHTGAAHGGSQSTNLAGSLSRRDAALMDADCCGDSGCGMPLARSVPATRAPSLPCDRFLATAGSAPLQRAASSGDALATLLQKEASIGTDKPHKWACMSDGQAAVQLFHRLNHARQTVDFVRRQRAAFTRLNKARMTVFEALAALDTLREYETALLGQEGAAAAREMGLAEHAFQTAEACRLAHPDAEWLQLAGLLHGLGKLLAHPTFGAEAQWAVCGESFPVGCQHSANITAAEYFCVNPDRRRRMYNTPTGMYARNCGLGNVMMSWSGAEYLHLVLTSNRGVRLPGPTLWLLRHSKFRTLAAGDYGQLLDDTDRSMVPWLAEFQELSAFKRQHLPGRLHGAELREHYAALLAKHLPEGPLRW
jgi:inositol oxygenase